jgi:hypothetical protein
LASQFHIFRWREEDILNTGQPILRPTVDLRVSLGPSHISQNCLIDTGAPITVLPRGVGVMLDIDMPADHEGGQETILLLGEAWPCVERTVTVMLPPFDDLEWEAPVRFSVREGLPYGLLGYEGFLKPMGGQLQRLPRIHRRRINRIVRQTSAGGPVHRVSERLGRLGQTGIARAHEGDGGRT